MQKSQIVPGQRYITTSEPALGLGHVLSTEGGHVEICFPAAEDTRTYAIETAPLVRVRFVPGDEISDHEKNRMIVESVTEEESILTYHGSGKASTNPISSTPFPSSARTNVCLQA